MARNKPKRRRRRRTRTGGVVVWKPIGLSSRRALEWAQSRLNVGDLGHTGTLDPRASGVLVLIGGEARKFQELLSRRDKVYVARIWLGIVSGSEDSEGPLWSQWPRPELPSAEELGAALESFGVGYDQVPPTFSAVRRDGQRLHELARRGEEVEAPPARSVELQSVRLLRWEPPVATVEIACSAGTYIRSFARDLGERLGVGAHLCGLRRTAIGSVVESTARPLQSLRPEHWLSLEEIVAPLPAIEVTRDEANRMKHGQFAPRRSEALGERVAWCEGRVLGLARVEPQRILPKRWLADGHEERSLRDPSEGER